MMRAFTLLETIIAIALTTFITLMLAFLIQYFYKTNAYTLQQSEAVESARQGVNSAMESLREASYGADGSYPISTATTSSITFYADVLNNGVVEEVTYYLQNGTFYEAVTDPAGNPPSYVGQPAATSTIATSVVNGSTPVFTYYDDNGNQLALPIDIGSISSVLTTIVVDVNINRAPTSYTLSAGATLRNLLDQ